VAGGIGNVTGRNALAVMWLEHLLVISMLQHASGDSEPVKVLRGFRPTCLSPAGTQSTR
jgi:hypothetical protein